MSIMNLDKGIYMLANKRHIYKLNSNLIIVCCTIKEPFLFKVLELLSLLLCLAYSKKISLSFNSLVRCQRTIYISLMKR
jgi:hypothetical protein